MSQPYYLGEFFQVWILPAGIICSLTGDRMNQIYSLSQASPPPRLLFQVVVLTSGKHQETVFQLQFLLMREDPPGVLQVFEGSEHLFSFLFVDQPAEGVILLIVDAFF